MDRKLRLAIEGCVVTSLFTHEDNKGSVLHFMQKRNQQFVDFGEVYFSTVNYSVTKGWKTHQRMTMNLVVPVGKIEFTLVDGRSLSSSFKQKEKVVLSPENYKLLTVPPGVWMSFKGLHQHHPNVVANFADIQHDPHEAMIAPLDVSPTKYNWSDL